SVLLNITFPPTVHAALTAGARRPRRRTAFLKEPWRMPLRIRFGRLRKCCGQALRAGDRAALPVAEQPFSSQVAAIGGRLR
ncbi:hypothetical protein ACFWRP_20480, partial [Streptomyces sp. NPDC058605]